MQSKCRYLVNLLIKLCCIMHLNISKAAQIQILLNEAWRILNPVEILCILPLFIAETYSILVNDPLVNRQGIVYDDKAEIIEVPWFHNRFGRFYDINTFKATRTDCWT